MHTVILSADSFRQIMSSALEAYAVPHGRNQNARNHSPLETYGTIWGYKTERGADTFFHVVASDTDTSAHRNQDFVAQKAGSNRIKAGFYSSYNPELSYLGDFHSHPYSQEEGNLTTAQNVETQRLFRFSGAPGGNDGDFASVRSIKNIGLNYSVGLVATIYRMTNCVQNPLHAFLDGKSAVRFTYNGPDTDGTTRSFRCWIKAYVFTGNDDTPAPDRQVRLHCSALGLIPR